jgi:hypothetical protein
MGNIGPYHLGENILKEGRGKRGKCERQRRKDKR